ncbi:AMP-dependent synthetase and ligase family protein, partial [Prunus dulcis]
MLKLGVLKGWLSVISLSDVISVWVMKDYGVKESWSKEHEFKDPVGYFVTFMLKAITEEGQILGIHRDRLQAYTTTTTGLVTVEVDGLPSWISEAWDLVPSFVSLKDIARGLQLEELEYFIFLALVLYNCGGNCLGRLSQMRYPKGEQFGWSAIRIFEDYKDTGLVENLGENVEPVELEEAAMRSSLIQQIVVVGQDQRRLGAIIVPNKGDVNASDLSKDKMTSLLYEELRKWTSGCSFQIGPILIVDEPFTIDSGLMTPTMKIRRDRVAAQYKEQIENLYNTYLWPSYSVTVTDKNAYVCISYFIPARE